MAAPFMKAYSDLLVATCHRRGAYAIGGMAAFIPSRRDPEINAAAFAKVRADKTREADAGYEGSWVAHPDLVPICREIFDAALGSADNQLDKALPTVDVSAKDLLDIRSLPLTVTAKGLQDNVVVALEYIVNWLAGSGAVGINNLMEDAATAEISRCQIWQWRRNRVVLDIDRQVTSEMIVWLLDEATEILADTWSERPGGRELAGRRQEPDVRLVHQGSVRRFPDDSGLRTAALNESSLKSGGCRPHGPSSVSDGGAGAEGQEPQ